MEAVVTFFDFAFKLLAFEFAFFWPGYVVLKALTFGKYPRLTVSGKEMKDYGDMQVVAYFGLFVVLAVVALAVKYWPK